MIDKADRIIILSMTNSFLVPAKVRIRKRQNDITFVILDYDLMLPTSLYKGMYDKD